MKRKMPCFGRPENVWDLDTHPDHKADAAEPCSHCYLAANICEACPFKRACWRDADHYGDEWHIRAGGLFGSDGYCLTCQLPLVSLDTPREEAYCSTQCQPVKKCTKGHVGELVRGNDGGWRCKACRRARAAEKRRERGQAREGLQSEAREARH